MPITTTPSGGPQGEFSTYTPIYSQTLTAATASITFSNIPTTFTDLVMVVQGTVATNGQSLIVRFNSDSGSNYSRTHMRGSATSAESVKATNLTALYCTYGVGFSSTSQSEATLHALNYSNTTTYKTILTKGSNVSGSLGAGIEYGANLWRSTSAITSMTISAQSGNMNSGLTLMLYGIKAAAAAPKATGGDLVYTDNTYWYHVFKNSGIFDVRTAMNVDYLVVAGGGGGGGAALDGAGGGGAGGYRTSIGGSQLSLSQQPYPIVVGAGGAGGAYAVAAGATAGSKGADSVFSSITSTGGGFGNVIVTYTGGGTTGGSGGSGGGGAIGSASSPAAAGGTGNSPSTSPSQGNNGGGVTYNGVWGAGGGGGGSGGVGGTGTAATTSPNSVGGNGGAGTANSISGSSVTYAGGGGGSSGYGTMGSGGSGGGGAGTKTVQTGNSGSINTGSGGGGGAYANSGSGGAGGSGIVIVRYAV